jgi:hypothetical protein
MIPSPSFREQLVAAATYVAARRNPSDGGWGLNIESEHQASSIVNTAEAIFTIRRGRVSLEQPEKTVNFLKKAISEHPGTRGDRLRYLTFGVMGLLEAGLPTTDQVVATTVQRIEERIANTKLGWSDGKSETQVRIWPTFLSLASIKSVLGLDRLRTYTACISHLIDTGKRNGYRWGFGDEPGESLAATSYVSIILSCLYPGAPETRYAYKSVQALLEGALDAHRPMEIESIPGTDWHHYSYCWALKALATNPALFERPTYHLISRVLQFISSLFVRDKGYQEPGKNICNVRSIYNNVVAVSAVIEGFDPSWMVAADRQLWIAATPLGEEEAVDEPAREIQVIEDVPTREGLYFQAVAGAESDIEKIRILKSLSGGYSGATLDLCEIWHKGGVPGLYQVLKLAATEDADREARGAKMAAEVVPPEYRVDLFDSHSVGDGSKSVLRYRYASATLMPGHIVPFLEYLETIPEPGEVGKNITELFEKALGDGFSGVQPSTMSLRQVRDHFEAVRNGGFWCSVVEGIEALEQKASMLLRFQRRGRMLLRFPYRTISYCLGESKRLQTALDALFVGGFARVAHGDLNPRNILMVRSNTGFRPVLIDFNRFGGPAPLPLDFCRLEVGVNVKGLRTIIEATRSDPKIEDELVAYEARINDPSGFEITTGIFRTCDTDFSPPIYRAALIVGTIRNSYRVFSPPKAREDSRAYFGTLALYYLNYVRPLYQQMLTLRQRLYALYCATSILERYFLT